MDSDPSLMIQVKVFEVIVFCTHNSRVRDCVVKTDEMSGNPGALLNDKPTETFKIYQYRSHPAGIVVVPHLFSLLFYMFFANVSQIIRLLPPNMADSSTNI